MKDPAVTSELNEKIAQAHSQAQNPLGQEEIIEIVNSVLQTLEGDVSPSDLKLYRELDTLAHYIKNARAELASIRPDDISKKHIPTATDELDAIIGATEEATGVILDASEQIEHLASKLSDSEKAAFTDQVTRIYQACNFQDITGQRISKVVKTLKTIEEKIVQLLSAFGEGIDKVQDEGHEGEGASQPSAGSDEDLLNGPQLPGSGIDQSEIDKLFG